MRSLSSREVEGNGPMKPGNPLVLTGRVPIPADLCVPQDEGIEQECSTPENAGVFLCLLKIPLCSYPHNKMRICISIKLVL
jgi:hypothetical protein